MCTEAELQSSFVTENFKTEYLIQFPDDYKGIGMVGFEGNIFTKYNADTTSTFYYAYCSPVWCDDFGDAVTELPDILTVESANGSGIVDILENTEDFCETQEMNGRFYYDDMNTSTGVYYMYVDTVWREALRIEFDPSNLNEIKLILASIHEK